MVVESARILFQTCPLQILPVNKRPICISKMQTWIAKQMQNPKGIHLARYPSVEVYFTGKPNEDFLLNTLKPFLGYPDLEELLGL